MSKPTRPEVAEKLNYDPATGVFTWKVDHLPHVRVGDVAGTIDAQGYRVISVLGKRHKAHHLAWLLMRGEWPKSEIDHKNRDRADNRIENLRVVSHAENTHNISPRNRGLPTGVYRKGRGYYAQIQVANKPKYLGMFDTAKLAEGAYLAAKKRFHGGFIE
jgi:hypothetical protein